MWRGLTVAFIGGDAREAEMARLASEAGAVVRVFGTPEAGAEDAGVRRSSTLLDALRGARVAIGPVPFPGPDGRLFAPAWPEPIYLTREALEAMDPPAHVIIGKAGGNLLKAARAAGVAVHEYENDTELMLLRAPAVAEGAIRVAIERSPVTIHGSSIGVVGFGRTARVLVRDLLGLSAKVHVFARRPEARAEAYAFGANGQAIEDIPLVFPHLDMVFSTVPARLLTRELLGHLRPGTTVIDMAAPPGSVDLDAAAELGLDSFWARGLGGSAPRTVAESQWRGVSRIVQQALGEDREGREPDTEGRTPE